MAKRQSGMGDLGKSRISDPSFPLRIPERGGDIQQTPRGYGNVVDSGTDLGPYFVEDAGDDNYYQGPTRSSCVVAHQFVPLDSTLPAQLNARARSGGEDEDPMERASLYLNMQGNVYVKFKKPGNKGPYYKYGPCTLQDYRKFRESTSKGRSVRSLEVFGYAAVGADVIGLDI
jgi:hypothetical protein